MTLDPATPRGDHDSASDEATAARRPPDAGARPPVLGLVQGDHARATLPVEIYSRVMEQAVAESPVRLEDVEDFNVTNLSWRALEDDVRAAADVKDHPLILDVLVDPAGLDHAIALDRLRRIVNDRSNPIDAIRLLGEFDPT